MTTITTRAATARRRRKAIRLSRLTAGGERPALTSRYHTSVEALTLVHRA